jgi:hypothetical protein
LRAQVVEHTAEIAHDALLVEQARALVTPRTVSEQFQKSHLMSALLRKDGRRCELDP